MSLEMAKKVTVPQKKNFVPQFLKQQDINSYFVKYSCRFVQYRCRLSYPFLWKIYYKKLKETSKSPFI